MALGVRIMRNLLLVVALFLSHLGTVEACSCMFSEGSRSSLVRSEFKDSDVVFSAYVHSVFMRSVEGRQTRMAKLRVMQVWKGSLAPNSWVDAIADLDYGLIGCGYEAVEDQALMVYARGKEPFGLAACSQTGQLHDATPDIPLLNRLAK